MDDSRAPYADVEAAGLRVRVDRDWHMASLRYFEPAGPFASEFLAWTGTALPEPLRAVAPSTPGPLNGFVLAWRGPTETWAFGRDAAAFRAFKQRFAASPHGCCVDQSGAFWVLRATGDQVNGLLARIGSAASRAPVGAARVSRIAELPVLTMCITPGETLLVVERVFAEHLLDWIRVTAEDFDDTN
jgi:sarcosine oxidase gamma subunit